MKIHVAESAAEHLAHLIAVLLLPEDTRARVRTRIETLAEFPDIGVPLPNAAHPDLRFIVGPWRWMLIVYQVDRALDVITVIAIEDARMSATVISTRT